MATIDEDLSQLEKDIRQLKIDYEQYFGGGKTRPPTDAEWRIDTMLKRYGDRGGTLSFSQRFRFSNLAQMYAKYKEMFRKRLKQKEEGRVQRHFGAAAREIEKERARKHDGGERSNGVTQFPFALSCEDPEHEQKKIERLYEAFRSAKEQVNESTAKLTLETFQQFLLQKTDQLRKQQNAHEIEYVVALEGNRASLKARVKS
jgi:hypothetical protein